MVRGTEGGAEHNPEQGDLLLTADRRKTGGQVEGWKRKRKREQGRAALCSASSRAHVLHGLSGSLEARGFARFQIKLPPFLSQ